MKSREECRHETVHFGSGDYYIFCDDCTASWMMRHDLRQEYAYGQDGQINVGGAPDRANLYRGPEDLCGTKRVAVTQEVKHE